MFNFFNNSKDENEPSIEQENLNMSEQTKHEQNKKVDEAPVHGENGVCCGGCGGESK